MLGEIKRVLVLDESAGLDIGHHRHWLDLLKYHLGEQVNLDVVSRSTDSFEDAKRSRRHWYSEKISQLDMSRITDLVLLSGDDAVGALIERRRALAEADLAIHVFLFRLDRQPGVLGLPRQGLKRLLLLRLALQLPSMTYYALQFPIGKTRRHRGIRTVDVFDSSALESGTATSRAEARSTLGWSDNIGLVFLVIGVLGSGKHVDTILDTWRQRPTSGDTLLFAGQADEHWGALIDQATCDDSNVRFIPGRLDDRTFDLPIAASDVVLATYRYSASSGVALRALASNRVVIVGGSATLIRQMSSVPGVVCLKKVDAAALSEAMNVSRELRQPSAPLPPPLADTYPHPIVRRIASR